MPKKAPKMETYFEVTHKIIEGKNTLTFQPKHKEDNGYGPKTIEVTEEQWNALKYHFATGVNDTTKESILAYVY
jgi:hypothetical protein